VEEIGKHISELLFDHDCVIVPSLGGFLASNQPSRILQPNQIIFPPYRRIAFNVYLKQNDGLLANHVAECGNIPYTEATQLIDSFTSGCFETLDSGRKVNIAEVGTLFYDKEKNIQFEASRNFNHLKDSFGMEALHFLPLQNEEQVEKKKISAEKILRPSLPAKEKSQKFNLSKGKKYLGIAAIVAGLVWFSLNLYLIAPKHYESTSLNPFDSQSIILNKIDSVRNIPATVQKDSESKTEEVAVVPSDTIASIENNRVDDNINKIDNASQNEIKKQQEPSTSQTQTIKTTEIITHSENKHYIIAGVFKIRENALSLLLQLQQQGFANAQIIEANKCSYVSYESYTFQDQAMSKADSLHKNNFEGWVWKH
jgi:hypothetical protein